MKKTPALCLDTTPGPGDYETPGTIGLNTHITLKRPPAYTFGTVHYEGKINVNTPSPMDYNVAGMTRFGLVKNKGPKMVRESIALRKEVPSAYVPGPGYYSPENSYKYMYGGRNFTFGVRRAPREAIATPSPNGFAIAYIGNNVPFAKTAPAYTFASRNFPRFTEQSPGPAAYPVVKSVYSREHLPSVKMVNPVRINKTKEVNEIAKPLTPIPSKPSTSPKFTFGYKRACLKPYVTPLDNL